MLARRRGWQRVVGNDGRAVVLVDEGDLGPDSPPERPAERPPDELAKLREEFLEARVAAARAEGQGVELHNAWPISRPVGSGYGRAGGGLCGGAGEGGLACRQAEVGPVGRSWPQARGLIGSTAVPDLKLHS